VNKLPDRIFRLKMANSNKKFNSERTTKSKPKGNVQKGRDSEIEGLKSEVARLKAIIESKGQAMKSIENKAEESNAEDLSKEKEEDFLKLVASLIVGVVLKRHGIEHETFIQEAYKRNTKKMK